MRKSRMISVFLFRSLSGRSCQSRLDSNVDEVDLDNDLLSLHVHGHWSVSRLNITVLVIVVTYGYIHHLRPGCV